MAEEDEDDDPPNEEEEDNVDDVEDEDDAPNEEEDDDAWPTRMRRARMLVMELVSLVTMLSRTAFKVRSVLRAFSSWSNEQPEKKKPYLSFFSKVP